MKRKASSGRKRPVLDVVQPGSPVLGAADRIFRTQYRLFNVSRNRMLEHDAPEALHDMRVAIGRFRAGLRLFRPLLSDIAQEDLNRLMSKFRTGLGTARDSEVWVTFVDSVSRKKTRRRGGSWAACLEEQKRLHVVERKRAVRLLSGAEYARLDRRVGAFLERGLARASAVSPGGSFEAYVAGRLRRGYKRLIKRKVGWWQAPPEEMHALRRKCRRLRYWAEFAAPVLGKSVQQLAVRLKAVTTSLGNLHDMDLYLDRIRAGASDAPAGLESAIRRRRATALRAFGKAWSGVRSKSFSRRVFAGLRAEQWSGTL